MKLAQIGWLNRLTDALKIRTLPVGFVSGHEGTALVAFCGLVFWELDQFMKSVDIAVLKNNLRALLGEVKEGEEILVCERNRPVARIVPLSSWKDQDYQDLLNLASQGKLRVAEGLIEESFWNMPTPRVSIAALRRAVEQERSESKIRESRGRS